MRTEEIQEGMVQASTEKPKKQLKKESTFSKKLQWNMSGETMEKELMLIHLVPDTNV